jgi:hypothetical protein
LADKFGVYLADKGITGRAIAIRDKAGEDCLAEELRHTRGTGYDGSLADAGEGAGDAKLTANGGEARNFSL